MPEGLFTKARLPELVIEEDGKLIINPDGRTTQNVPAHEAGRALFGLIHVLDGRVDQRNLRVRSQSAEHMAYRYDKLTGLMIEEIQPLTLAMTARHWVATGRNDPGYRGPDDASTHMLTSHLAALLLVTDDVKFVCPLTDANRPTLQKYLELATMEPTARKMAMEAYMANGGRNAYTDAGAGD